MTRVVDNVRRSLEARPRPVTVIYARPRHGDLWTSLPTLRSSVERPTTTRGVGYRSYAVHHFG